MRSLLTNKELVFVNKSLDDCTEDEKLIRKRGLYKIKDYEERKKFYKKKHIERIKKMEYVDHKLSNKNIPKIEKQRLSKKLGMYLINHGKEKLGLEYMNIGLKYMEELKGRSHPQYLTELTLYSKMETRTKKIIRGRRLNREK
tara:strand:+ start:285 stop:713 length:429 start_codon:yes stop_codon:yes gene_type:complete